MKIKPCHVMPSAVTLKRNCNHQHVFLNPKWSNKYIKSTLFLVIYAYNGIFEWREDINIVIFWLSLHLIFIHCSIDIDWFMYNEYITNMASHCLFRLQTYRWISDFNVQIVISIIRRCHHEQWRAAKFLP